MNRAPLRLYGSGRSRWVRPLWMLRELDVPFEAIHVDRAAGELAQPAFRALNPAGRIPVLLDEEGRPIAESGAILLYLGDRFPAQGLLPPAGTYARGVHDQWMFSVVTELEPPLWRLHRQRNHAEGDEAAALLAEQLFFRAAALLETTLAARPHLTGEVFQAADIMLGHLLTWAVAQPLLTELPALTAYRDRITARPAFPAWLYEGEPWCPP